MSLSECNRITLLLHFKIVYNFDLSESECNRVKGQDTEDKYIPTFHRKVLEFYCCQKVLHMN